MENDFLHAELSCPICDAPIHVVADPTAQRSRWCCVPCRVVGISPFTATTTPAPGAKIVETPSA